MIYIINNDGMYSDRRVHFVEAEPKVMDEILDLMAKAFPRVCTVCSKPNVQHGLKWCDYRRQLRHSPRHFPFLMGKAEKVEWFAGKPQTLEEWLSDLDGKLNAFYASDDKMAARDFGRSIRRIMGDRIWLDDEYYGGI